MKERIPGVVIGLVVDLEDPEAIGRIRLRFPWMSDDNNSAWARVATMFAGDDRGSWFMPEVGDEVLVAFLHGDVEHPYIVGFLWNGKDKPPTTNRRRRLIRSLNGHEIEIYDPEPAAGDQGFIRLKDAHGNMVELANAKISIQSVGTVEIKGPNVTINGRVVAPTPNPI